MASVSAGPNFVGGGVRPARASRIISVDELRGLVMVLMALDHVREYFTYLKFAPTDIAQTWGALFFTRWITHLCAPTFVFLAGTSIYLQARRKSRPQLTRFLLSRGLWLCFVEIFIVNTLMDFNFDIHRLVILEIWIIGISMMIMAALIQLPVKVVAGIAIALLALHNLLDPLQAANMGAFAPFWHLLHEPGMVLAPGKYFYVIGYPLLPWLGVMALGYAFGVVLKRDAVARRRWMLRAGAGAIAAFLVLRAVNWYGDPAPWKMQASAAKTIMSFLNVTKYPPSLLFVLVTLGISMCLMSGFERLEMAKRWAWLREVLSVYGRVPFFYYLLHIFVAHALVVAVSAATGNNWRWWFMEPPQGGVLTGPGPGFGFGLPVIWGIWMVVVVACYPACKWYAELKQRSRNPLLSYL